MKSFLSSLQVKHIPLFFLSVFTIKCLFCGAGAVDVAFLAVLGAIAGFYEFKGIQSEVKTIHTRFENVDKVLTEALKQCKDLRTEIGSLKIPSAFRKM